MSFIHCWPSSTAYIIGMIGLRNVNTLCDEGVEHGVTKGGLRYWVGSKANRGHMIRHVVDERLSLFYTVNALHQEDGGAVLSVLGGRTFREQLFKHAQAQYLGRPLPSMVPTLPHRDDNMTYDAVMKAVEWWSNPLLAAFYDTERVAWMDVLTPGRKSSKKATDGAGCSMMMMVRAAEGREGIITGIMGKGSYAMYVSDEDGELEVTDLASEKALYNGKRLMIEKGMGCYHLKDPCFGIIKEGEIPRMSCMPDVGILPRIKGRNWIVLISVYDPLAEITDGESVQTLVKDAFSSAREIESVVVEILSGITGSVIVMIVDTGDAEAHPAFTKELFAS